METVLLQAPGLRQLTEMMEIMLMVMADLVPVALKHFISEQELQQHFLIPASLTAVTASESCLSNVMTAIQ